MTVLVPFDGSELATAALEKATRYGELTDEDVVVLSVVPDDDEYARERGWIDATEGFDPDVVLRKLRGAAERVAPDADVRHELVDSDEPTATPTTDVVRAIRDVAADLEASVVFVGSENVGSVTTPLSSVGGPVAAADQGYDVYVVRHAE